MKTDPICVISASEYARLLSEFPDPRLPVNYADYLKRIDELCEKCSKRGSVPVKVLVDLGELVYWCTSNRMHVDAEGREAYAAHVYDKRQNTDTRV